MSKIVEYTVVINNLWKLVGSVNELLKEWRQPHWTIVVDTVEWNVFQAMVKYDLPTDKQQDE